MRLNKFEKAFNKEIESIRELIQSSKPFPDDKAAQKKRITRAAKDLEFFGKTYFPHYITQPNSEFHKYICQRYSELIFQSIKTGLGDKEADASPRGHAKSTWTTLILPIWCVVYKYKSFILEVSETSTQAEDFLSFIKLELENNERLAQDFPHATGEGKVWRQDVIITNNGIKIRGVGSGQKLRGMRHGSKRPDLVIVDDIENDESVESAEQRKKLERWFFKVLTKIGQKDTIFIVIGTILHYDSLLSYLLRAPGWKGKKFKAVLRFSDSKLWDEWEHIFTNIDIGKKEAEARADEFFFQHQKEMLKETEVLWPEMEDYYYLMKKRISEGIAYFESEKQNEPINLEDSVFLEEWIQYYDENEVDLSATAYIGACDPSMGKKSKTADPSAIIAGRMKDNIIYLDIADIEKRHPDKIINDILTYHERQKFDLFGIEEIQFQEFFKDHFEKEAHKRGLTINVKGIRPNTDKDLRILSLQPWIKNGWIRFKKHGMKELIRQLIYYRPKGKGGHDDGIDALEMLKTLMEQGLIKALSVASETGKNDYRQNRFQFSRREAWL